MNRQQEFWELKQQLQQPPPELDGTAQRARQRAKHRRMGRGFGISLGSLAGVCAAFILAVNTMPTFALACGRVPILRELAAAVALSPSLSAAVEHNFVQYVGQTQTIDSVAVTVEYVIADEQQIVVFYRTAGSGDYRASCNLLDGNGTALHGYSVTSSDSDEDLKQFEIHCKDITLPETLVLELSLRRFTETGDSMALDGVGRFSIHLDPEKTAKAVVVPVEQWVDLDGQRLLVDRLELTPTRTLLYLDEDPSNTAWLQSLDFWFTAPDGTLYDQQDGTVAATGDADHPGFYTFYFQSLYFVDHPEQLTLHIAEAVWLDKSEPTVTIDLTSGAWTGSLPEGVVEIEVQPVDYDGSRALELTVSTTADRMPLGYLFTAPDGSAYDCRGYSYLMADGPEHPARCCYYLTGYNWDTITAALSYTDITTPPEPLTVPLS